MRDFRKFNIWVLGMELIKEIYPFIHQLPATEQFAMQHQMRKAVVSMPSNIAEGCSRTSDKEFARFLEISLGSAFELETLLLAAIGNAYLEERKIEEVLSRLHEFQKRTNALRTKLRG